MLDLDIIPPSGELPPGVQPLERWRHLGACRGHDPDLWYPERGEGAAQARRICRSCPVREECLEWAVSMHERYGVWGGASPRERQKIRRQRREQGHQVPLPITLPLREGQRRRSRPRRARRRVVVEQLVLFTTSSAHAATLPHALAAS